MALSGLLWPISAIIDACGGAGMGHIWHDAPWSGEWFMTFFKWVIVNAAAALPVLVVKAYNVSNRFCHFTGYFIHAVLGANILWTLIHKVNGWVRFFNFSVGISLTISLVTYMVALAKSGESLLEKVNGVPYGRATPLPWLICYTIWNATFVADLSIGMTLQDILFWAMMIVMQRFDRYPLTIDLYFAFARPIQLGTYIALGCWTGIVPWFRDAELHNPIQPLGINDDFYFLFITLINLMLSFFCLYEALQALMFGQPTGRPRTRLTYVTTPIEVQLTQLATAYEKRPVLPD